MKLGKRSYIDCFRSTKDKMALRTLTGIFVQAFQQLTGSPCFHLVFYHSPLTFEYSQLYLLLRHHILQKLRYSRSLYNLHRYQCCQRDYDCPWYMGHRKAWASPPSPHWLYWDVSLRMYRRCRRRNYFGQQHCRSKGTYRFRLYFHCLLCCDLGSCHMDSCQWNIPPSPPCQGHVYLCCQQLALEFWYILCQYAIYSFFLSMEIDDGLAPYLVNNESGSAGLQSKVFFIWGSTCFCGIIFSFLCIPEVRFSISIFCMSGNWYYLSQTQGLSLEQIDVMYREVTPIRSLEYRRSLLLDNINLRTVRIDNPENLLWRSHFFFSKRYFFW